MQDTIQIPATTIPVIARADVVVVGGGPGGFAAALRAARHGATTILVEMYDMPGGFHTMGLQGAAGAGAGGIHSELMRRMEEEGLLYTTSNETHPYLNGNPVSHYGHKAERNSAFTRKMFNPEGGGIMMLQMLEEAGVKAIYGTRFLDVVLNDSGDTITEIIVDNASGRQAIRGKVFIDGTGTAGVVEKSGAPFVRSGGPQPSSVQTEATDWPIPGGILWTMAGVDYPKLVTYQKTTGDWALSELIDAAKAVGDIPDILFRPRLPGKNVYGDIYIGKPTLDMTPIGGDGGFAFWQNVPYEWQLRMDESYPDETYAKAELRKLIGAEAKFLKKYVPGFQNAFITQVGHYMGIREPRHPIGEYVLTIEDAIAERTFHDNAITRRALFHYDGFVNRTFQVPYRCFLPRKINNLLLTGASMSFDYSVIFMVMRAFPWCIQSGEIGGYAAGLSVEKGIPPKELEWTAPYTF